jgi:hypothetical protein
MANSWNAEYGKKAEILLLVNLEALNMTNKPAFAGNALDTTGEKQYLV